VTGQQGAQQPMPSSHMACAHHSVWLHAAHWAPRATHHHQHHAQHAGAPTHLGVRAAAAAHVPVVPAARILAVRHTLRCCCRCLCLAVVAAVSLLRWPVARAPHHVAAVVWCAWRCVQVCYVVLVLACDCCDLALYGCHTRTRCQRCRCLAPPLNTTLTSGHTATRVSGSC
jgi:hypothetical protein